MNSMVSDNSGVGKSRDGEYKTKRNARVSTVIYIGGERFEGNARRALRRRRKINVRLLDGLFRCTHSERTSSLRTYVRVSFEINRLGEILKVVDNVEHCEQNQVLLIRLA